MPKVVFVRDHRGDVFWETPVWTGSKASAWQGVLTQSKEGQQEVMSADLVSARMDSW